MGFLYGLIAALVWGAQPVVASFGYRAGLNAFDLTLLRCAASGLIMLLLLLWRGRRAACAISWRHGIILFLLAGPLYNLVLIGGLTWAPASHSSLMFPAFTPIFTAVLARIMLGRHERIPLFGLTLLVVGVLTIKLSGVLHPANDVSPNAWRGDLLFIAGALMWSLYTVLMRRWRTEPLSVVTVVQIGGLLYLPFYFVMQGLTVFQIDLQSITVQTLYHGVLVSVVSVLLFNLAVRQIGAIASMFTALMPVIGVSLAVAVLGEPLTWSLIAGTVLVGAGLIFSLKMK